MRPKKHREDDGGGSAWLWGRKREPGPYGGWRGRGWHTTTASTRARSPPPPPLPFTELPNPPRRGGCVLGCVCTHACVWSSHQPPSLAPTQAEDHQGLSLPASCHPHSSVFPGAQDTGRALMGSDPSLDSVAVSCNTGTMKNLFMRKPSSFKSPSFNSNWEQLATS